MTYESLKRACIQVHSRTLDENEYEDASKMHLPLWQRMMCAAISGISSWSVIFPLDVVRSRMYFESISDVSISKKPKSTWSMIQQMYLENGKRFRIFFRGYGVTILRAGPVAAVVLPVYDTTLEALVMRRQG